MTRAFSACSYISSSASAIASRLVEWRGWMVAEAYANSPSIMVMKSRSPKDTCALETQLTLRLAIRGLVYTSRRAKVPYLALQLSVFRVNTNE